MLSVFLLEDDPRDAERIVTLLARYREEHPGTDSTFSIRHYRDPVTFLTEYRCQADLLLMDIQLPDMTGIEAAKRIREIDPEVMIIFITSLAQYAIEGYSVSAFDYILKPLRSASFLAKMERALRVLDRRRSNAVLTVSTREEKRRVPLNDILYIEVNNHDIFLGNTDFSGVDELDLYTIFQNILDNAIEAVVALPEKEERFIILTAAQRGNILTIHTENPCGKEIAFQNGLPQTQGDPTQHGFGVKSILRTAEKYHGTVSARQNGCMFNLEVLLVSPTSA